MINDQVSLVQVAVNSLKKLKENSSIENLAKNVSDKKEIEKNSDAQSVGKTENGNDVTNSVSENKPSAGQSKDSNGEEVPTRSRGRKKAELKERSTDKEEQALPIYENGSGSYKIAEEMRNIIDYMKQNGADANEIATIKANYDQLNMALGAHEDGVLPEEEFKRAAANLTGARNKIEEFLNRNTNIPGTERTEVTLHNRQTREYGLNFQDSREYYYEDGKRGISPYSKYTYVFHNYRATNVPRFDHQPVSNAEKYIHVRVDPTDTGFLWTVSVNAGRFSNTTNDSYWFTIPKGQHYKQGSANVDVQNLQGTNSYQGDGSLEGAMRQAGLLQVNKGANLQGVFRQGKFGANAYKTDNFEVLARENVDALTDKGFYNRVLEQGEEQNLSNAKFNKIKKQAETCIILNNLVMFLNIRLHLKQ